MQSAKSELFRSAILRFYPAFRPVDRMGRDLL